MWNLSFAPPFVVHARILTRLPASFRKRGRTDWCDANKPGHEIDSFLEGPSFDRAGNLLLLQSRPETVWSAKESEPVAAPQANPLAHLLTVFGGKR